MFYNKIHVLIQINYTVYLLVFNELFSLQLIGTNFFEYCLAKKKRKKVGLATYM